MVDVPQVAEQLPVAHRPLNMMEPRHDTIFEEEEKAPGNGAEQPIVVDFELMEAQGRWLLKVVSGPNSGAEFFMAPGTSYTIGCDQTCDIVFNDLSVSRQHARLTVDEETHVSIEDLGSRNGTLVDGEKIQARRSLQSNSLVAMGTTTVMLIDREGERKTIISPLSFTPKPKDAKKDEKSEEEEKGKTALGAIQNAVIPPLVSEVERIKEEEHRAARHATAVSALIVLAAVTGLFVIAGVGTTLLFRPEKVAEKPKVDYETLIRAALQDYPAIRYSFFPNTGRLLLIGHILSQSDMNEMLDKIGTLDFLTDIDSSNVVIDELVWKDINQNLAKTPAFKGVTLTSPVASKFVLTGYLKTRKDASALNEYMSANFPYLNLLDNKVVVEEDLKQQILQKISDQGFRNVTMAITNGDLVLNGTRGPDTLDSFSKLLSELRVLQGVRTVRSFVTEEANASMVNISDKYHVSGYSALGNNISVVVNGHIVSKGDILDGMRITDISTTAIYLEKNGVKYRIDFNQ